jgi:hypothetical protein
MEEFVRHRDIASLALTSSRSAGMLDRPYAVERQSRATGRPLLVTGRKEPMVIGRSRLRSGAAGAESRQ